MADDPEAREGEENAPLRGIVRVVGSSAVPSDGDLALINERFSRRTLSPEEVFVFDAVATTDAVDAYFTHHDVATSLANFVADLTAGQSLLDSHIYRRQPIGTSFRAAMEPIKDAEGVPATKQVRAGYFMLRGHDVPGSGNTDEYIKSIESGIARRMSITFGGNNLRQICDIDGSDIWDWSSSFYPGQVLKDGTVVTYTNVDANLYETSIVYKNATPGSLIERINDLVARREIPESDRLRLEQRWHVRFAAPPTQHFVPGRAERKHRMDRTELKRLLEAVQQRVGKTISSATRQKLEDALSRLSDASGGIEEAAAAITALLEEVPATSSNAAPDTRALLDALGDDATPEMVGALKQRAAAGAAYTKRLIDEAVAAKVAVMGDKVNAETYRARLERMAESDFAGLEDEHATWIEQKRGVFKPGRQVPAGDPTEGDKKYQGLTIVEQSA